MITFKEYVNEYFDKHEQAMEFFELPKTTFYRRLKDSSWKIINVNNEKPMTGKVLAKVDQEFKAGIL